MSIIKDISGQRFGRLVAIARVDGCKTTTWKFACDCGMIKNMQVGNVRNGGTASCGCYNIEVHTKHGAYNDPSYSYWTHLKYKYGVADVWVDVRVFRAWYEANTIGQRVVRIIVRNRNLPASPDNCLISNASTAVRSGRVHKGKASSHYKGVFAKLGRRHLVVMVKISGRRICICGFLDHISAACCYDDIVGAINPGTAWLNRDHFPEVMEEWLKRTENNKALLKLRKLNPESVKNLRFQELKDLYNPS